MTATRPTALVICAGNPAGDPRPNRMIRWLRDHFAVRVISSGTAVEGTTHLLLPAPAGAAWWRKLRGAIDLKLCRYEARLWPAELRKLAAEERVHDPRLIVVHDLALLPLALAIRGTGRVFFDAREYYSRHFEDRWFWRFFLQGFNQHLCATYLKQADVMVTVNRGLADAYQKEFGVRCGVMPGFPEQVALTPTPVDPQKIRLIHHGFATKTRRIELMIEALRHADERFHLDLMLVGGERGYVAELQRHAAGNPRVAFRTPVPFRELVHDTNRYDIGLYLLPPTSFNTLHALPNKFFEFIHARLMLAIGPSPEMAPFVRDHELGVVASDFEPRTLAAELNRLSTEQIVRFKANAHVAAAKLSAEVMRKKLLQVALEGAGTEAFA